MTLEEKRASRREAKRRYKLKYPARFAAQRKADDVRYRATHKPEISQQSRIYRANHATELKLKKASYYQANKDKIRTQASQTYAQNKVYRQDALARAARYRQNNPDKAKEAVKAWCRANPERLRELSAKKEAIRRARKNGNEIEPYEREAVFARDNGICQLCQESVEPEFVWPHARSFSIDHIIPISKGGGDTPNNVATTHLVCNLRKSAKVLDLTQR